MHPTEKVKSKSDYEASMKQGVDSLKVTTPIEGAHLDSVISVLYEEYKQEYLNLGGTGKWTEALPIVLACEAIFLGDLPPKEEADLIYNIGYIYQCRLVKEVLRNA